MRRILLAILLLIFISFGYIGVTTMDKDANPPMDENTGSYIKN